ncbi:MAG TPA: electron transfer flavoprotein subunit beta/FixA family protein [Clostridia bacterium]
MKILVCIKQVPNTTTVAVDETTGTLKRDGVESKMNPYDLYALEAAFRIREEHGGSVTVLSMGPAQAKAVLQEALHMGADHACLLTDRKFAGADVLATSYTLAQGIHRLGDFDLLVCGKQTTDGDTAQVGAEVAEFLHWPHAANVSRIESISAEHIVVRVNMEQVVQTQQIRLPCLITVEKDIHTPRLPSYRRALQTKSQPVQVMGLKDFADTDERHYGLTGSPTHVEKIYPPEHATVKQMLTGNAEQLADQLFTLLTDQKMV